MRASEHIGGRLAAAMGATQCRFETLAVSSALYWSPLSLLLMVE